jgi:hypothetical protein
MGYTGMDKDGLQRELDANPILRSAALKAAEEISAIARGDASVVSGAYRDSITAEATKTGARVVAGGGVAAFEEFGVPAYGQPPKFNLRQAVIQAGYRFKKHGA